MATEKQHNVLQWLQLVILTIGVGGVFMTMGSRNEVLSSTTAELAELKGIVHDLVKAQVGIAVNDARHEAVLDELKFRISELERKR